MRKELELFWECPLCKTINIDNSSICSLCSRRKDGRIEPFHKQLPPEIRKSKKDRPSLMVEEVIIHDSLYKKIRRPQKTDPDMFQNNIKKADKSEQLIQQINDRIKEARRSSSELQLKSGASNKPAITVPNTWWGWIILILISIIIVASTIIK
jgi:hypothetical protein